MLNPSPPRGHRHNQLMHAARLVGSWGSDGRLLDLGAGSGWLGAAWEGPAVCLDVRAPDPVLTPWMVADSRSLPVRSASVEAAAAIASLGAFDDQMLASVLQEVARVLVPGGRVVALVSLRHWLYDAAAPHRIESRWRWRSFEEAELVAAVERNGLSIVWLERRGGLRTLLVDWLSWLGSPLRRAPGGRLDRLAELDAPDFEGEPRSHSGRYLYLVAQRGVDA